MEILAVVVLIFLIIFAFRKLANDQKDQSDNKNDGQHDILKTFEQRMLHVGEVYYANRFVLFNQGDVEKKIGLGNKLPLYDLTFIFGAFDLIRQELDPHRKIITNKEFFKRMIAMSLGTKIVKNDLEAKIIFTQILHLHEPYNVIDDLLKDGAFSCDNYLAD